MAVPRIIEIDDRDARILDTRIAEHQSKKHRDDDRNHEGYLLIRHPLPGKKEPHLIL